MATKGTPTSLLATLAPALIAFLGVIAGSLITGIPLLRAQELQYKQAAYQVAAQQAQTDLAKLREVAAQYLTEVERVIDLSLAAPPSEPITDSQVRALIDSSIGLYIYSDPPLADATASFTSHLIVLGRAPIERKDEHWESVLETYAHWFEEFRAQVAAQKGQLVPEAIQPPSILQIVGIPTPKPQ